MNKPNKNQRLNERDLLENIQELLENANRKLYFIGFMLFGIALALAAL